MSRGAAMSAGAAGAPRVAAAVGAVVLAAGRGERLGGVCKAALVRPGGATFLAAIVATARAAGVGPVVVVGAAPHGDVVRALAWAAGVAFAWNPAPEQGMASSFAVGLAALPAGLDAVLAWPVDHPDVTEATLAALVAAADRARVVVPEHGGRGGHPTVFGAEHLPACRAAAAAPDGLRAVLRAAAAQVTRLGCDDPGVVRDIDSPADYAMMKDR